jgi:hypothetical protein
MILADYAMKAFALLNGGGSTVVAALTSASALATRMPATPPSDQITPRCAPQGSPRERHRDEMIRQGLMS